MIDLVVGYARGYTAQQVRPFLQSLRETGYDGRIVWFADGGAAEEGTLWKAEVHHPPTPTTKVHHDRFYHIEKVVRETEFEGVFLGDTRDTIFQKNVSEHLPSVGWHAFEEDRSMTIGSCPYNSKWIRQGWGDSVLREMRDLPISCVGSLCGDKVSARTYLNMLANGIRQYSQDTGWHNYLIRTQLPQTHLWTNEEGEVYTVGYCSPRGSVGIVGTRVVNRSGKVPTVVHQWDRHPNLKALVEAKYLS